MESKRFFFVAQLENKVDLEALKSMRSTHTGKVQEIHVLLCEFHCEATAHLCLPYPPWN